MTLAPEVTTGLAVSTTRITGDCTGIDLAISDCGAIENRRCSREREPLQVYVAPVGTSIPIDDACAPDLADADVRAVAVYGGTASGHGELVISLDAGSYTLLVSDGRCARCGLGAGAGACVVEVVRDQIAVRDLVLH
jgi:hypothetical protein